MGELAKVVRWATPGVVGAFVMYAVFAVLQWGATGFGLIPRQPGQMLPDIALPDASVAAVAACTIPAGFLVYQAYFYRFHRRGVFVNFVHRDLGGAVLRQAGRKELVARCACAPGSHPTYSVVRAGSAEPRFSSPRHILGLTSRILALFAGKAEVLWIAAKSGMSMTQAESDAAVACHYTLRELNWKIMMRTANVRMWDFLVPPKLIAETDRLADIYHTLGAVREAMTYGAVLGTLTCWGEILFALLPSTELNYEHYVLTSDWTHVSVTASAGLLAVAALNIALGLGLSRLSLALHANRRNALNRQEILLATVIRVGDLQAVASSRPQPRTLKSVYRRLDKGAHEIAEGGGEW